jgi:hypothetical protein
MVIFIHGQSYAFGEMDKDGKFDLGSFASQEENRVELDFRPTELMPNLFRGQNTQPQSSGR